jgi:hypothetical protein
MKLISGAGHARPPFTEVGAYKPGFFGSIFRLPTIVARLEPTNFKQSALTQTVIDFETTPVELGVRHFQDVVFGTTLYKGIRPMTHKYDNVYMCYVDAIESVRVEKHEESCGDYGW